MQNAKSTVDYYLDMFRNGKHEDAFYGLIDLDAAVIPELINAYEASEDTELKIFAIRVVSEFRLDSSICFLRHALRRTEMRIWKGALDGLAMAESECAIDSMEHVLSSITDNDKREWIEEAISGTKNAIEKKAEPGHAAEWR